MNSLSSALYTPWNTSLHSADTADVLISYNGTTRNLSVSWTYQTTPNSQGKSSLSYQVDLATVLPQSVTVGFSASTGSSGYFGLARLKDFDPSYSEKLLLERRQLTVSKKNILLEWLLSAVDERLYMAFDKKQVAFDDCWHVVRSSG
ncbi:L-type lectin-domain containing receptor kinase IX.1-like [Rosa rugosa]|uniref:L-type lectin-domain containing receptor kinase IX.1-like n=1 Tax=Rosa rugosa TaxID=74645 RepID=UPI002B4020DA|nr:L-type lectin-domain containing receptor kinase IX.1-like [Rosa rugosa]